MPDVRRPGPARAATAVELGRDVWTPVQRCKHSRGRTAGAAGAQTEATCSDPSGDMTYFRADCRGPRRRAVGKEGEVKTADADETFAVEADARRLPVRALAA